MRDDAVSRLARLDTCAVSDALDKLGLEGTITGLERLSSDRAIAGKVLTVRLDTTEERGEGPPRHLCTAAIEAAEAGDVIVVEQRTGQDAAGWGGTLSLGATLRGLAGVIVEGPARDIDESRKLDFPVFARSHTARTARGRVVEVETNGPVHVGAVSVSPGDFVVADATAVVFVARDAIGEVLDTAERIARREAAMAGDLRAGRPISQVMGADYEDMLRKDSS
jgi:4-hydroxy-4-methyl-2-oxoglutarate aldolase